MKKIGDLLIEMGVLTPSQVGEVLRFQEQRGGRFGTVLLELGHAGETRFLEALSRQLAVPAVRAEDLRQVDPRILELVPAKMAQTGKVVPFDHFRSEVSVAMLDPRDLILQDELAFVLGKRIKVHVAPEVRIREALQRHYGLTSEARYQNLWKRLNRIVYGDETRVRERPEARTSPAPPLLPSSQGGAPPPGQRSSSDSQPLQARELLGREAAAPGEAKADPGARSRSPRVDIQMPPPQEPAMESPSPPPSTVEELERRLAEATERDEIGELAVGFLGRHFRRALLFMARGEAVAGWLGTGDDVDQDRLAGFEVGFDEPSLFLNLREGSPFYRGPLPAMPAHRALAAIWGGASPAECLLLPVFIRERMVGVVYCDRGDERLRAEDVEGLRRLAKRLGRAFEQFVLRKKAQVH